MSENWKRWEGRSIEGRFPLHSYLGGSDHSSVFLTFMRRDAGDSEKAAIKLITADPANAEKQLLRWEVVRELNHANLIRIFQVGRCELDGTALLYAVMEYAEETLSQILPERALTADETRGMLSPVLRALQYVHEKRLVHTRIQPSNILAVGEEVKVSSDAMVELGEKNCGAKGASAYDPPEAATAASSTAAEVWQLGMTLVEALTQRLPRFDSQRNKPVLPDGIPQPFREIVENCLQIEPAKRWTVIQIANCLDRPESIATPAPTPATVSTMAASTASTHSPWPYRIALVAAVLIALFLIARPKPPGITAPPTPAQNRDASTSSAAPLRSAQADVSHATPNTSAEADHSTATADARGRVVERIMPRIPPGALHTITGKIRIQVKINVDEAGNVAEARLKSPGPSKYFAGRALEAARGWKFKPALENGQPVASQWIVQFILSRRGIDDSHVQIKP
jgi:TonB family protein